MVFRPAVEDEADRLHRDMACLRVVSGFKPYIAQGRLARDEEAAAAAVLFDREPMAFVILSNQIGNRLGGLGIIV